MYTSFIGNNTFYLTLIPGAGKDENIEQAELSLKNEEQVVEEKKEVNDTSMENAEKIADEDVHDGM